MKRIALLICALACFLSGCGQARPQPREATVFAMDTVMSLRLYGDAEVLEQAETLIRTLEGQLSVTDPGSEIYALNRDGYGSVSPDTAELLARALELCAETDGALDISIYPVLKAWGFTSEDDNYTVPDLAELTALLARVGYRGIMQDGMTVSLAPGMEIDLGSVAKGYTGDRVLRLFRDAGVTSALLDLGGNVQALGAKPDGSPWRVAIRDPEGDGYIGVVEVTDKAVITSGGYERYFVQDGATYWHILDPATGAPARSGLISSSVIGEDGVVCDALSTALFVMGAEKAAAFWREHSGFEFVLLSTDGTVYITEGLEETFTLDATRGERRLAILHRNSNGPG